MERLRRRRPDPQTMILAAILASLTIGVAAVGLARLAVRLGGDPPGEEDPPVPDYVERDYLTVNEWSRPGDPLEEVRGVAIHYVGNPGTSARANRNYFQSLSSGAEGIFASSHFIVGLEGEVLQCVPLDEIAYATNARNADTVSIEVCHPDETGEFDSASYGRCVELTAWLCRTYGLDPAEDVIRHYDVTGKLCPLYYVEHPEAWDELLLDVAEEMEAQAAEEAQAAD